MKLVALELSGFRGFAKTQAFDLDAEAIIVVGANGHGKTSLFDGVLWALCGRIPRLAEESSGVISLYSDSGQARAVLTLRNDAQETYKVTRSYDGSSMESRVSLQSADGTLSGPAAEGRLLQLVWSEAEVAMQPFEALASVLTRSVYLQQDVLRHFVEAADDHQRFYSVSELFGAGRVTEIQGALERAKKAWTTATNQRTEELSALQTSLGAAEGRARELGARVAPDLESISAAAWAQWWSDAASVGLKVGLPEYSSRDAARAIDGAIKEIDARRAAADRTLQTLRLIEPQLASLGGLLVVPDIGKLREQVATLSSELESLKRNVTEEQTRLAELRRAQAALKQKDEQLRVLASIALQHLGNHCPVCAQTFDHDATRMRLEALAKTNTGAGIVEPDPVRLKELLDAVAIKEKELSSVDMAIRAAQQKLNEGEMLKKAVAARLTEVGISSAENQSRQDQLRRAIEKAEALNTKMRELLQGGEALALRLSRSAAQATLSETRIEIERLQRSIAEKQKIVMSRNETGEIAQRIIEGLREAASTVVEQRLNEITPLLQDIYSRIDPHPTFETVEFVSRFAKGRGHLSTVVRDSVENKSCPHPPSVLSSSQVNALAVSIFLSFNLGIAQPPLASLLLDDPLQCLDDVNLLGLVDLLRRTKDRRQLCVSTHDIRFANLLSRKLRPSDAAGRTIVIELEGWHREGPIVTTREVPGDPVELRLVAG